VKSHTVISEGSTQLNAAGSPVARLSFTTGVRKARIPTLDS
jgi:hypothetical protein